MNVAVLAGWIPEEWRARPEPAPEPVPLAKPDDDPVYALVDLVKRVGVAGVADALRCSESVVYTWTSRRCRPNEEFEPALAELTGTTVEAWAYYRLRHLERVRPSVLRAAQARQRMRDGR